MKNKTSRIPVKQHYSPLLFVSLGILLLYTFVLLLNAHTKYLPKSVSYHLDLTRNRIPFLIEETDPLHETRKMFCLGVWDLDSNHLTRDTTSIGFVEGDCIVKWQGHRRIFVTSKNAGGCLYVEKTNPFFEFVQFQANDPLQVQILDDPTSDLYYLLDRYESSDQFFVEIWIREKKTSTASIVFEDTSSEVTHFLPLSFTWKNQAPYLVGEGVYDGIRYLFTGVLHKNHFLMKRQTESILDWNMKERDSSRELYYDNCLLLTQKHPVGVQSYNIEAAKRNNFETVNNYIDMFYSYLFGTDDRESSLTRRGIHLQKPQPIYPVLGYYRDTLITKWSPLVHRRVGEDIEPFSVVQMQAIRGNRLVSRIDQVGELINVYSAFSTNEFYSEKCNIYLDKWILPNHQGDF
ncbi:MAG: hypothetical protein PHI40_00475 [Caldisericia bacterium]|nr:hypothetical protein [Caldisericia bacterium]MDD4613875.1 hypothetical protein [Caldisericia bacterium]